MIVVIIAAMMESLRMMISKAKFYMNPFVVLNAFATFMSF